MTRSYVRSLSLRPILIGLILGITACISAASQTALFLRSDGLNFPTPGMPFQAEGTAQTTQKLPDGNTILHELHIAWGRDPMAASSLRRNPFSPRMDPSLISSSIRLTNASSVGARNPRW